ncbi:MULTISPECIES: rhodanese-like domain-containing protein [unclassified Lonepinella]|uniref:rhodanese-like domain-containing protein n=1 Tax=unclassified Lonepinella TaxID=2642006 RepID=UPI0036DF2500
MEEFMPLAAQFAKNHTLLVVAWVAVFIATIYVFVKSALSKVKLVNNSQAVALINNKDAVVIDLRSIDEFKRGHIINSKQFLPTDIKKHNLGKIEQHKEMPIILVCATGAVANTSAEILSKQGFVEVYVLQEGIAGWNAANLPLVK